MTPGIPEGSDREDEEKQPTGGGMTLLQFAAFIVRNRGIVLGLPLLAALVTVVIGLLEPHRYEARASFIPQTTAPATPNLSGLAAQLGIGGSFVGMDESPAFYADLVKSREVLSAVAARRYSYSAGGTEHEGDLPSLYGIETEDPEARIRAAVGQLQERLKVRTRGTGIVSISVQAPSAQLSALLASAVLDEINRFNLEKRQSRAAAERQFVEARLERVRSEHRQSEYALKTFLQQNRGFRNSPDLQFEHDRLQRDMMLRQEVLLSLIQNHERARIEEVKNIPVITVIENPWVPSRPEGRRLPLKVATALLLGGLVAIGLAAVRESVVRSKREGHADYLEFRKTLQALRGKALGRRSAGTHLEPN